MLSEISQRQKEKILYNLTYICNLKTTTIKSKLTEIKKEIRLFLISRSGLSRDGVGGGDWRKAVKRCKFPAVNSRA